MIPYTYFEKLYDAERSRWDHWTDFCWWLEENVIPGVERYVQETACSESHCEHEFEFECTECGELIYL